jgi:hypothetical protein
MLSINIAPYEKSLPCYFLLVFSYRMFRSDMQVTTVNVPLMRDDAPSEINNYLKFSHYLPLQTDDNNLIGEISKIQMIYRFL